MNKWVVIGLIFSASAFAKIRVDYYNQDVLKHVLASTALEEIEDLDKNLDRGDLEGTSVSRSGEQLKSQWNVRLVYEHEYKKKVVTCTLDALVKIEVVNIKLNVPGGGAGRGITVSRLTTPKFDAVDCEEKKKP